METLLEHGRYISGLRQHRRGSVTFPSRKRDLAANTARPAWSRDRPGSYTFVAAIGVQQPLDTRSSRRPKSLERARLERGRLVDGGGQDRRVV
jgi:hypothetical protein